MKKLRKLQNGGKQKPNWGKRKKCRHFLEKKKNNANIA